MSIAEIGARRLENVLAKDKMRNPKLVCEVIGSDITKIVSNYAEIMDNVDIDMQQNGEGWTFIIKVCATRIKSFGSLPDLL